MGTLSGHVVPGSYCMILGFWWLVNATCRYSTCKKHNIPFRSSSWFLWNRFPNTPIEPLVSVILFSIDSACQIYWAAWYPTFHWGNIQHMNVYVMVIISGITQLLLFKNGKVVYGFDYICFALASFTTIIGLSYHLHGRPPVDVTLHMLIIFSHVAMLISTFLEAMFRDRPLFVIMRGMFMFLVGMNLIHTGYIIYPPGRERGNPLLDLSSHSSMMMVSVMFGFEVFIIVALVLLVTLVVASCYSGDDVYLTAIRNTAPTKHEYDRLIGFDHDQYCPPEYFNSPKHGTANGLNHKLVV